MIIIKKNDFKYDIYFRPETTKFILLDLDDLSTTQLKKTLAQLQTNKYKCSFLIQTSKKNYQAWFYCPQSTDWETYKQIAKHLANKFGGDLKSCKSKQVGRLPPYKNKKQGREDFEVKTIKYNSNAILKFTKKQLKDIKEDEDEIDLSFRIGSQIKFTPPDKSRLSSGSNPNWLWAFCMKMLETNPYITKQQMYDNITRFNNLYTHIQITDTIENATAFFRSRNPNLYLQKFIKSLFNYYTKIGL